LGGASFDQLADGRRNGRVWWLMHFHSGEDAAALNAATPTATPAAVKAPAAGAAEAEPRSRARRLNLRPLASLVFYVRRHRWRALAAFSALFFAALTTPWPLDGRWLRHPSAAPVRFARD
jgi:hypothetical protein